MKGKIEWDDKMRGEKKKKKKTQESSQLGKRKELQLKLAVCEKTRCCWLEW